jgi:hypothetical protein
MLERTGLPLWGWMVGAALGGAVIALGYRTVSVTQSPLTQMELVRTSHLAARPLRYEERA